MGADLVVVGYDRPGPNYRVAAAGKNVACILYFYALICVYDILLYWRPC